MMIVFICMGNIHINFRYDWFLIRRTWTQKQYCTCKHLMKHIHFNYCLNVVYMLSLCLYNKLIWEKFFFRSSIESTWIWLGRTRGHTEFYKCFWFQKYMPLTLPLLGGLLDSSPLFERAVPAPGSTFQGFGVTRS